MLCVIPTCSILLDRRTLEWLQIFEGNFDPFDVGNLSRRAAKAMDNGFGSRRILRRETICCNVIVEPRE